jgi:hypothetical protein
MYERVQSLYQRAETGHGRLAYRDVEQLDDVTLEYLALWLALLVMDDRAESVNLREVEPSWRLERELAAPRSGTDLRQLQKARADYAAVIERHQPHAEPAAGARGGDAVDARPARRNLPDDHDPAGPKRSATRLEEAIGKLRLQEDIEADLASDLAEACPAWRCRTGGDAGGSGAWWRSAVPAGRLGPRPTGGRRGGRSSRETKNGRLTGHRKEEGDG